MPLPLCDLPEIEYLDGAPHPKVSPKVPHSLVQGAVIRLLQDAGRGRGYVMPELRVVVRQAHHDESRDRPTEFVPDVAFISKQRLDALRGPDHDKPPFSPEIALEVRSPSDDLRYLSRKIDRYLATGSVLVLDVDPASRTIAAHSAGGLRLFTEGQRFTHPAVPWLRFNVRRVFATLA